MERQRGFPCQSTHRSERQAECHLLTVIDFLHEGLESHEMEEGEKQAPKFVHGRATFEMGLIMNNSRFPTSKICFPRCLGRTRRSGRVRGLRERLGDFRLKSKCIFNQISLPTSAFANAAAANVNTIQGPSRPRPRRQAPPTTTTTSTGCVHTYLIYVKALAQTRPCV